MIATGLTYYIPIDMSSYELEDILERFSPYKDSSKWEAVKINLPVVDLEGNTRFVLCDSVTTDDMVINRITSSDPELYESIKITTGILGRVCPRLCRVDQVNFSLLLSYPYFPEDDDNYNDLIVHGLEELKRVSMFLLGVTGKDNLGEWERRLKEYVDNYYVFLNSCPNSEQDYKHLIKRVYNIVQC